MERRGTERAPAAMAPVMVRGATITAAAFALFGILSYENTGGDS